MMAWIQFRRIPDVMAERVKAPSFVYTEDEELAVTGTSPPLKKAPQGGWRPGGRPRSAVCAPLGMNRAGGQRREQSREHCHGCG